jgi:hypothetical protein
MRFNCQIDRVEHASDTSITLVKSVDQWVGLHGVHFDTGLMPSTGVQVPKERSEIGINLSSF